MLPLSTLVMFFAVLPWHLVAGKFCEPNKTKSEKVDRLVFVNNAKQNLKQTYKGGCPANKTMQNLKQTYKNERLVNKTKQNLNETSLQR